MHTVQGRGYGPRPFFDVQLAQMANDEILSGMGLFAPSFWRRLFGACDLALGRFGVGSFWR